MIKDEISNNVLTTNRYSKSNVTIIKRQKNNSYDESIVYLIRPRPVVGPLVEQTIATALVKIETRQIEY